MRTGKDRRRAAAAHPTSPRVALTFALAAAVAATLALPADALARPHKAGLDRALERTPIIVKNAYKQLPPMGRRGQMGNNLPGEGGGGFQLADQQLGDLYVRSGLVYGRPKVIRRGFRAFDYAFRRQRSDGSLPEDQAEGYAFFVEAVAHSALLLQKSRYAGRFRGKLGSYRHKLERAARHMITPAAFDAFKGRNSSYTHSGYSVGTALTLTGKLVHNGSFRRFGRSAIKAALDNQRSKGANPELGGYDVRYQTVGIAYAERFRVYFPGGRLKRRVEAMTRRGLRWMDHRVDRDGYIQWRGSTRACRELASDGDLKSPGYPFAVRAFAYWGALNGRDGYIEVARHLNRYSNYASGKLCGPKVDEPRKRRKGRAGGGGGGGGGSGGGPLPELPDILPPAQARDLYE